MANTTIIAINSWVKIISDADREIYDLVNYVFLASSISLFGMVANVMNMVVFYKQGFTNTMNISFFGLAISDLCGLLILLWCAVCFNPLFSKFEVPIIAQEVQYLTGGMPRVYFGRISAWITVFITAERCLSVMVPLKVKLIITPTRTTVTLCAIYAVMVVAFLPEYITSYLDWTFHPGRNRSLLGLTFTEQRSSVEGMTYILYSFLGSAAFVAVIMLTAVLVFQLKQKSKWRMQASADTSKSESISNRERKTVTMVVMIATVLIVCYTPGAAVSMVTFIEPDFGILGNNINVLFVMWSFVFISDAINSSVNIFLYYKMSSKYRETFNQIFGLLKV